MSDSAIQANVEAQLARLENFTELLERIASSPALQRHASVSHTLLLASILKVIQSSKAVRLLAEAGCVEEVLSIGRTMVEVTANAAYLQHAPDKEVHSYLHFHPETANRTAGMLSGGGRGNRPNGIFARIAKAVSRASADTLFRKPEPTWSNRSLLDRAEFADAASQMPVMSLMVRRCFSRGHAAVLGAVGSLHHFIIAAQHGDAGDSNERVAALTEAIFGVNLSLFTFCFYLSGIFDLKMDAAIEEAANAEGKESSRLAAGRSSALPAR